MRQDKVITLIRKLKEIANPLSNASENERANANTRIEELTNKYSINESESSSTESLSGYNERNVGKVGTWVTILAKTISEYFDCQYAEKNNKIIVFFGSSNRVKNAGYAFDSVYNQIQELSKNYSISEKRYYGFKNFKSYKIVARREFKEGLATGLYNRVKKKNQEGLILNSEHIANEWLSSKGLAIEEAKRKSKELHTRENHFEIGLEKSILLMVPEAALPNVSQV